MSSPWRHQSPPTSPASVRSASLPSSLRKLPPIPRESGTCASVARSVLQWGRSALGGHRPSGTARGLAADHAGPVFRVARGGPVICGVRRNPYVRVFHHARSSLRSSPTRPIRHVAQITSGIHNQPRVFCFPRNTSGLLPQNGHRRTSASTRPASIGGRSVFGLLIALVLVWRAGYAGPFGGITRSSDGIARNIPSRPP